MTSISLCMITKNEQPNLSHCLTSVQSLVDEIIIVDTGSTDNTKKVASKFTKKVYDFSWNNDFAAARNESLKYATKEWILVLDADEVVAEKDHQVLRQILSKLPADAVALTLLLREYTDNYRLANWVSAVGDTYQNIHSYAGWVPHSLIRVFRNNKDIQFKGIVHETVTDSVAKVGKVAHIEIPVHHLGSDTPQRAAKNKYYLQLLQQKVAQNPDYASFYELGREYLSQGQIAEAQQYLEKSIQAFPTFADGLFLLGNIFAEQGNDSKAIEYYRKALFSQKSDPALYSSLGSSLFTQKQYEEARDNFLQAIRLNPKNASSHYNIGLCFLKLGEARKAVRAFKNAISLNPVYAAKVEIQE